MEKAEDNFIRYSVLDTENVAEAMFYFVDSEESLYEEFCSAALNDYSIAEWVVEFHLSDFDSFCKSKYGFALVECL